MTRPIRIVFLGTPEFACPTLDLLLSEPETYEIVAVVTQPDRPAGRNLEPQVSRVKELAVSHLGKLSRVQKKYVIASPESVNDPEFIKSLGYELDIAVVVAFGQILKPPFLSIFKHGAVNVHASLLPRWRGAAPIQWALLNQDPVTGVSLQKIADKLDSGDVIASAQVVLDETYDALKLYSELSRRGADLVRRYLSDYVAGRIKATPQDETQMTLAPKIKKEQGIIDWNVAASQIVANIRALTPWPGVWTTREGKQLKILRAKAIEHSSVLEPGFLISMDKFSFGVQCGNNTALIISVVQPESRSRMPASEYLKGYSFKKGDKLGG
jgi:methionyl-tRNA formyltransferase